MFGNKNVAIGLDIGSYAVKAVALHPNKGRLTLAGYAQQRIGSDDPAEVVRQVMSTLGAKQRNIVTAVSGRSVIVRQVETPKLAGNELRSHITYEADKYIPFGADEVVIDCQPLDHPDEALDDSNQQVQLVAVRRGFIEDHVAMVNKAGLHPKVIDVDVFALCNAYEVFGPDLSGVEEPVATALVDIGASKVCVAIIKGRRPLFTREFYLAGNEITDAVCRSFGESPEDIEALKLMPGEALDALVDAAMPSIEDLANEIRLSFDYVEGQFDEEVQQVVLTGGSSQLATLGDIIGNMLGRPVQVFDPLAGLDLVPSRYDIQGLDANAPGLAVALGLACHIAGVGMGGLGGAQLNVWTPRSHAGVSSGMPMAVQPPSEQGMADQETLTTDLNDLDAAQFAAPPQEPLDMPTPIADLGGMISEPQLEAPPAPYDEQAALPPSPQGLDDTFAVPDLPPPVDEPPLPGSNSGPAYDLSSDLPPDADNLPPPPPPGLAPTELDEQEQDDTNYYRGHSSVLVILDDEDDEMAPRTSDIVRRSTNLHRSDSSIIDESDDDAIQLPPLD